MGNYIYCKRTIAFASIALLCSSLNAQDHSNSAASVTVAKMSERTVAVGAPVDLFLEFNVPQPWCGLEINWGDGEEKTVRVGHEGNNKFPLQLTHTYQSPGQFTLKITGKNISRGLRSASACEGLPKKATVTVESALQQAAAEQQKAEEIKARNEVEWAKEAADKKSRELDAKEAELRRREEKLEKDRRVQDKREQELKAKQQVVENKGSTAPPAPAPSPQQPVQSKKPTIDPF